MNVNKLAGKYEQLKDKTRSHSYITIKDNNFVEIECCRKVTGFGDNIIELEIPCGLLKIVGPELRLKNFGTDSVKIYGRIHSIGFEENTGHNSEEL